MDGKIVDERIAAAKACGLPVFNFTDMLVVPEKLLIKYADEMTVGQGAITKAIIEKNRQAAIHGSLHGTGRRFSILRPMTQKVVRAQIDEVFKRFPDLSGIFIRFGETYLHDTPYHGQESSLFQSSSWWCRDEYLTALNLQTVVDRDLADKVLEEKAKAVADWKRVERMAREIRLDNAADQEFLEVSGTYGRIKMAITEQIWSLQILAAQGKTSSQIDLTKMRRAIETYDALWAEWRRLKAEHACCPTLYRDDMAVWCGPPFRPTLDKYRKLVDASNRPKTTGRTTAST